MGRERLYPTYRQRPNWRAARAVLAISAAVLLGLGLRRLRLQRVVVTGESMLPAFEPGDRLILGPAGPLRAGQVVGLRDPRDGRRMLIKRIRKVDESTIEVRGDNEGASTDSRVFGPVSRARVAGRALYRYGPKDRTGWLPQ